MVWLEDYAVWGGSLVCSGFGHLAVGQAACNEDGLYIGSILHVALRVMEMHALHFLPRGYKQLPMICSFFCQPFSLSKLL